MRHTFRKWLIGLIVIAFVVGAYVVYVRRKNAPAPTRYVTANVERGTLVVSVSGSGQISALNQADVKPKAAGDVASINVREGQAVRPGTILIQLDARDAEQAVRTAQTSIETAELALAKIKKPVDALTILQSENALIQAQESKEKTEEALRKAYEDGFNATTSAFLDLPGIMSGLQDMLLGTDRTLASSGQWNIDAYADSVKSFNEKIVQYRNDAYAKYKDARTQYDATFQTYKMTSRFAEDAVIEALIRDSYATTRTIAEATKNAMNLIQFYQDRIIERGLKPQAVAATHLTAMNAYTGKLNAHVSSIFSVTKAIDDQRKALVSTDRTIVERTESFRKLKEPPDPLDVRAQEITIQQRRDTLADAQRKVADYTVRAPFGGVIAEIHVTVGDAVSSGTTAVTIITQQKIAEISLNEIDAAKVRVGQRATLTFDAIPGLTATGEVTAIDAIGTVSQGVVTYTTEIRFDAQDERVKPGMSASAAIITDVRTDVLLVPIAAVKQQDDAQYVELLVDGAPQRRTVETGLASDTQTEIVSGLEEGMAVITQAITASTASESTSTSSGFRIPGLPSGGGRSGGGGTRIMAH